MGSLYRSPLRVYLTLGMLSLVGIWSAMRLPISLFPNSSKPDVHVCMPSEMAPESFLRMYGTYIEEALRGIVAEDLAVEKVTGTYNPRESCFDVEFKWGNSPQKALREVQTTIATFSARLPAETRDRVQIYSNQENSGFLAILFFSRSRTLDELHKQIEPLLAPALAKVKDANDAGLWNPQQKQLIVELRPEAMAAFGLFPRDVAGALQDGLAAYGAGSLTVGTESLSVQFPRPAGSIEDISRMPVAAARGRPITLGDVARIDAAVPVDSARIFKTNGTPSLILFATPKAGGNVKAMAEDILAIVAKAAPAFPKDVEYRILVDPSEFIQSAVSNVSHEVLLAALLAVIVLFLFVGNARNVATAAIEIPISIVLAFILMRLTGVNLNLVSLGGLALSAGMNVDASVVVMENIFRVFDQAHARGEHLDFERRAQLVGEAVNEVKFAVIASTIASLVVFIPLAFTSDLSYALLGDLAKAVVFSHGFSAIVALILVPTIRLQLLGDGPLHEKPAPLERTLAWLEEAYARTLAWYIARARAQVAVGVALCVALALVLGVILPRLPREIVGKPDTDWIMLRINTRGNTLTRQMDAQTEVIERQLLEKFSGRIQYTFVQVNRPNSSSIMARLRDKRDMDKAWKDFEAAFPTTPFIDYAVEPWNPAELPIPNPPDFKATITGSDADGMATAARDLTDALRESKAFPNVRAIPNATLSDGILVRPRLEAWPQLTAAGLRFTAADLADLARTAIAPRYVTRFSQDGEEMDAYLRYPEAWISTPEELGALPIGIGSRIVPLKALASVDRREIPPPIMRENSRTLFTVSGRQAKGSESKIAASVALATSVVEKQRAGTVDGAQDLRGASQAKARPTIAIENATEELDEALKQLALAASLSVALILVTMIFQFKSIVNAVLVLVAIPLGFIGVGFSLALFHGTLSLNSMLGVILLNGIAVANSIILVDFLSRAVAAGEEPGLAAISVGRRRLRPILMTSLTTALGMLPIAMGFGEGGKILQPLGIAVAGGLGFSVATTLFVVPGLQVAWLRYSAAARYKQSWLARWTGRRRVASASASVTILCVLAYGSSARADDEVSAAQTSERAAAAVVAPTAAVSTPAIESVPALTVLTKASDASLTITEAPVTILAPPRPGDEPEIGFAEAFTVIMGRSLRVATQGARISVAEAQRLRALGAFLPNVSLQASSFSYQTPPNIGVYDTRKGYLTATVNVFHSGADYEGLMAARELTRKERAFLDFEQQGAEEDAANALIDVVAKGMIRDTQAQTAASKAEINQIAHMRFEKGLLPQQEEEKSRIELDNARANLNDAENELSRARATLRALLGRSKVRPEWPWKDVIARDGQPGVGLSDAAFDLRKRPDWRAADHQLTTDHRRARQAWRNLLPSLDFTAAYGSEDLRDPGRRDWSAYVTFNVNLFDKAVGYGLARERDALELVSAYAKETIERRADADVEISRQAHRIAARSALTRDKSLKSSRALLDDSERRFRMGRASVNDLAIDQARYYDSERLAIEGWSQAHASLARLCHVLGGRIEANGECQRP